MQVDEPCVKELKLINDAMKILLLKQRRERPHHKSRSVGDVHWKNLCAIPLQRPPTGVSRLVYVPTGRSGEFGGENDNCRRKPRHTAVISLCARMYLRMVRRQNLAKDNVPYKPKKFLRVRNLNGTNEEDFVIHSRILQAAPIVISPAQFIEFTSKKFVLLYVADLYDFQNSVSWKRIGKNDKASMNLKLAYAYQEKKKKNANTLKNCKKERKYEGLKGIDLISLEEKRGCRPGSVH